MTAENRAEKRGPLVQSDYHGPILRIKPGFREAVLNDMQQEMDPTIKDAVEKMAPELEDMLAVPEPHKPQNIPGK